MKGRILAVIFFYALLQNIQTVQAGTRRYTEGKTDPATDKLISHIIGKTGIPEDEITEELMQEIEETAEGLLSDPLQINRLGEDRERASMVLDGYMISSVSEYVKKYGKIESAGELATVPGFDDNTVSVLAPFLSFSHRDNCVPLKWKEFSRLIRYAGHEMLAWTSYRMKFTEGRIDRSEAEGKTGSDIYVRTAYRLDADGHIGAGITLEKERFERFFPVKGSPEPEMISGYLSFSSIRISEKTYIEDLVIGDYRIKTGQSLCIGSGSLFRSKDPSATGICGKNIRKYTSTDQNALLRGIAASVKTGRFRWTAFASLKKTDAVVEGNSFISKPETGIHDSPGSLASRKTMKELVSGFSAGYENIWLEIGINAVGYCFDKKDARRETYYNRFQRYSGPHGNASLDFTLKFPRFRIFGEAACDMTPAAAFTGGIAFPVAHEGSMSVTLMGYSPQYKAPYSAAPGGRAYNLFGTSVLFRYGSSFGTMYELAAEAYYHPQPVYGIKSSGYKAKSSARITFGQSRFKPLVYTSLSADMNKITFSGKSGAAWETSRNFQFPCNLWYTGNIRYREKGGRLKCGIAASAGAEYAKNEISLATHLAVFHTPEWDTRIYTYEKGALYGYNGKVLYGTGIRGYIFLKYAPEIGKGKRIEIRFKASANYLANKKTAEPDFILQLRLKL